MRRIIGQCSRADIRDMLNFMHIEIEKNPNKTLMLDDYAESFSKRQLAAWKAVIILTNENQSLDIDEVLLWGDDDGKVTGYETKVRTRRDNENFR